MIGRLAQAVAHAVVTRQVGRGLGRGDQVIHRQGIVGVRQADRFDLGSQAVQHLDRLADAGFHLGLDAADEIFFRHAHAQAIQIAPLCRGRVKSGHGHIQ